MAYAYADLTVDAPIVRATADLVVTEPVPARATADLVVTADRTMTLYRRVAGDLQRARLYRRVAGELVACTVRRRVGGELVPNDHANLPAPVVTATLGNQEVRIQWETVAGATGYQVGRIGGTTHTDPPNVTTRTFTGLTNNTPATFTVRALPSGPVQLVTATPTTGSTLDLRKPLIGAGGGPEATQWDPLNTAVGPMLARRSYDGDLPASFAASAAASDVAAGRHSYWSWKPSPTGFVSSGPQQAAFAAFLGTIPTGHKVTIFCHHEPEDNMSDFGGIGGYGALQDVVADIVRDAGNPNLRFGPCFMGAWTWDSRSSYYQWINQWTTVMDWSKFDVIGIDPYSTTYPGGYSYERILTVRNSGAGTGTAQPMMTWLSQFDIPIVIAEWGYYRKQADGHNNSQAPVDPIPPAAVAAWITEAGAWFDRWNTAHPPRLEEGRIRGSFIDAACWFNYTLMGSDCPLTGPLTSPTTTGPKIDAYRGIVTASKRVNAAPVADFTAAPTEGSAPHTVAFTDTTTNHPTAWLWQFSDGTTSTSQHPIRTLTTPGAYTVTLTAWNAYGVSVRTRSELITVT